MGQRDRRNTAGSALQLIARYSKSRHTCRSAGPVAHASNVTQEAIMTVTGPDLIALHRHGLWLVSQAAEQVSASAAPAGTRLGLAAHPLAARRLRVQRDRR